LSAITRPVLIGVGQRSQRDVTLETAQNPLEMLTERAHDAAESSGAGPQLFESIDTIALTSTLGWPAQNPVRLLADSLGASPAAEYVSEVGGETPVVLLNEVSTRIAAGQSELAFVGGCNNVKSLGLALSAGVQLDWPSGGAGTATIIGKPGRGSDDDEEAVGLGMPISIYPIFENALRAARGQSLEEHRKAMGALFHPFTQVAAKNPHAWYPTERSPEELVYPTRLNRMIDFPYPKYLNAVLATEQSAGLLVASEEMARRLGVPEENWIYWRGGAIAIEDPWKFSERPSLAEGPAIATCHRTALANAALDLDEIDLIDFYSCFPVAVAMACEMLGLSQDDPRGFTLTGGLPYAGGPGNSYSLHSIAAAVDQLREKRGEHALVTGNGWYLTKHSAAVLSRQPGANDHRPNANPATEATRAAWKADPVRLVAQASGPASVETYTIVYDRDGDPARGIIVGRLTDTNERFLANTPEDPRLLADLAKLEVIGTTGTVGRDDGKNLFLPS
jgi:acetyl-CoA C-acetyltransferase